MASESEGATETNLSHTPNITASKNIPSEEEESRLGEGEMSTGLKDLFERIISSDLFILSRQRDAADPSKEDQMNYLKNLFQEKPSQFVYRYFSCLKAKDGNLFADNSSDPTIAHYLKQLNNNTNSHKVIRNRRYKRMQELISEGVYFSDEEMRERDQKLHYQMIGQFETEEERDAKVREKLLGEEAKFSAFLLHQSDRQDYLDSNMDEQEEEEEEEEEDEEDLIQSGNKEELAEQFKQIMMERFLAGEDTDHISYIDIDHNDKYDDLVMRSRDAEDAYFDGESEDECLEQFEDDREFNPPPLRPKQIADDES